MKLSLVLQRDARKPVQGPSFSPRGHVALTCRPSLKALQGRCSPAARVPRTSVDIRATAAPAKHGEAPPSPSKMVVPSIREFLKGRTMLITGATGFLAKLMVEKILFEQPDVGKIYLLVRSGKGKSGQERVREQVTTSPAYDRLRQRWGDKYEEFMMSKLAAVEGELGLPNIGMADDVRAQLQEEVDVVVNCAANTVFDERFDKALRINTLGARDAANFAAGCKKLKVWLQVSTAFVNGYREGPCPEKQFEYNRSIAEELGWKHAPKLDVQKEIEAGGNAENLAREQLQREQGRHGVTEADVDQRVREIGAQHARRFGWQDTYVFTKAMGEMLIGEVVKEKGMPTVILRPGIIESAQKEPVRGWIEGIRMCDPILIAYGKNQLPGFPVERQGVLHVIPVDHVVNATLASMAWKAQNPEGIDVFQVTSSKDNPLTLEAIADYTSEHFISNPMVDKHGQPIKVYPVMGFQSLADFREAIISKWKPTDVEVEEGTMEESNKKRQEAMTRKVLDYAEHLAKIYTPYTFYAGRFMADRTKELNDGLQPNEKEAFAFDLKSISWYDYINSHISGLRKFPLHEISNK